MTHEHAVLADHVGAHAQQRRRVDVQGDGGVRAGVADAVDVGGGEVEAPAGTEDAVARRPVDRQALLAHGSADDGDGAGGDVVVMEAGVVLVHPADQPGREVIVAEQLLVQALGAVVLDQVDPQLRPVGELAHERLQLAAREIAPARARDASELADVVHRGGDARRALDGAQQRGAAHPATAICAAPNARRVHSTIGSQSSPSGMPSSPGSTTGRSDPYSSCWGPTSSSSTRTVAGP